MASNDPYTQAQTDILSLLDQTRPQLASYLRIRSSASSASTPELIEARQELEGTLLDLKTDLQDLVDSVKAVESDPYRYGLDVAEVAKRRKLVADVGKEVEDMHRQLNETVQYADGKAGLAHPDSFGDMDGDDQDDYGAWEEQRQMEIMHEQDEALDDVFVTVGNLRAQADTMGRELEEQAELLEDTENITDRVQGKLSDGMKKIRYVIEQNEGKHACNTSGSHRPASYGMLTRTHRSVFELLYHWTGSCPSLSARAGHHAMILVRFSASGIHAKYAPATDYCERLLQRQMRRCRIKVE
jgi:HPt (histidine-containing phosphotransfer) domain-containing protein